MEFKQEFLEALRSGQDHPELLAIVGRHQARGLTPEESYVLLHQIWLEFGFNKTDESSPLRDELEFVMERVWFEGSITA